MKKILSLFKSNFSPRVYLDYAGATPLSPRAEKALLSSFCEYGNASAIYKEGVKAREMLLLARTRISRVLSVRPHEIYFVSTGTESVSLAIQGVIAVWKKEKNTTPHVITSNIEHPSVRELLRFLSKNNDITLTELPVNENGVITRDQVKSNLTEDTALVTIMYVSNEIGSLMPIKEIGRMLREYKEESGSQYPLFHSDACQASNHFSLDVTSLKVDLLTINSSKIYGPKGIALLYKRENVLLVPQMIGGGQERGIRSGTEAVPLAVSFAEALDEAKELRDSEKTRLSVLKKDFKKELQSLVPSACFYGSDKDILSAPHIINCRVPGILSEEMIIRLDAKGFAVSHKSACASEDESMSYVVKALGASDDEAKENIRITMGRYTTKKDMRALVSNIKDIFEKYSSVHEF